MSKKRERNARNSEKDLPKSRAKETEFRLKKHKNELHILKMSQEWDLRRQKRRMDRQKWVEERRKQQLPIWQRVGNLRVRANDEILHEAGYIHINNKVRIGNSNEECGAGDTKTNEVNEKMKQNLVDYEREENGPKRVESTSVNSTRRGNFTVNLKSASGSRKQDVTTEHLKPIPQRLQYETAGCTNPTGPKTEPGVAHSRLAETQPAEGSQEKLNERGKPTFKEPEGAANKARSEPYTSATMSPTHQDGKYDRKRKTEATDSERKKAKLMCAEKPTTLEKISRQSGVVTTSVAVNSTGIVGNLDQNEKGSENMPQIKQCYSLLDRHDDSDVIFVGRSNVKSTSNPVSMAAPVTMTTASSEVKLQRPLPSVAVNSKCIVYLPKAPPKPHLASSSRQPQPGYLVPVFKQSGREPAYAFLPAGAQHPQQGGEKTVLEQRPNSGKSEGIATVVSTTLGPRSSSGLIEARSTSASGTGPFIHRPQPNPSSSGESFPPNVKVQPFQQVSSAFLMQQQNHVAPSQQKASTVHSAGGVRVLKEDRGCSTAPMDHSVKSAAVIPDRLQLSAFASNAGRIPEHVSNQSGSTQEGIFNPMSLYVKAKLVPREVVSPALGSEAVASIVDYIKTDAICDKELTKWNAQNVADFVAATDCMDKANLFLEQEIDGKALLSLSPEMLMKGMNLKLGPAVKLYNHIANLRTALLL